MPVLLFLKLSFHSGLYQFHYLEVSSNNLSGHSFMQIWHQVSTLCSTKINWPEIFWERCNLQLLWLLRNYGESKTTLEPDSSELHPSHNQQLFLYIFQIVQPNVRSLGSVWLTSTSDFDMPGLSHIWTQALHIRMPVNKKIQKHNRNICITCFSSLMNSAQITRETQN